jgi:TetR/AcrR family transcriptional regulator, transcriptional repressor for nem operon
MRYPAEHKQQTRERIVRAAAKRFRKQGGEGPGIAALMRDLRLTHGGFYRHFAGKDELFLEAFKLALQEPNQRIASAIERAPPEGKLAAFIEGYLDTEHCNDITDGCPVAALASELVRHPRGTRAALELAVRGRVQQLAKLVPGATEEDRESRASVLFSGIAGTLTLARLMTDDERRRRFLRQASQFYLAAIRG